jgi:hypothetical protein
MKGSFFDSAIWKDLLTSLVLCLFIIPPVLTLIRKSSRLWVKSGIEGSNEKLDLTEIWEMIYMFLVICFFWLLAYMIINKTLNGTEYTREEYLIVFSGTLGSNTASVLITYFKKKSESNNHEK